MRSKVHYEPFISESSWEPSFQKLLFDQFLWRTFLPAGEDFLRFCTGKKMEKLLRSSVNGLFY